MQVQTTYDKLNCIPFDTSIEGFWSERTPTQGPGLASESVLGALQLFNLLGQQGNQLLLA